MAAMKDPSVVGLIGMFPTGNCPYVEVYHGMLFHERLASLKALLREISWRQQMFLRFGPESIWEDTQVSLAEALGVNQSTVSRIIGDNHVRTLHGVLPLRVFSDPGVAMTYGVRRIAGYSVCRTILRLVQEEPSEKPLTDEALSDRLKDVNLRVAIRTVAKYRALLNIPAVPVRRHHRERVTGAGNLEHLELSRLAPKSRKQ